MGVIKKQITLDAKRFDTNPKREFLGPNKTRTIVDLEEYTREWSLEEIYSMDKTYHLCMERALIDFKLNIFFQGIPCLIGCFKCYFMLTD